MNKILLSLVVVGSFMFLGCGNAVPDSTTTKSEAAAQSNGAQVHYAKDALNKAAYEGDEELVKKIIATKPDPDARDSSGGTALHAAMFQKNIKIVKLLLDYGLDVNAIGPKNGYTPLHDAVWGNNPEAAKLLMERRAKTDIKNKEGQTPLEKAQSEGKTALVKVLQGK
jgi:ankyrin repeat protein